MSNPPSDPNQPNQQQPPQQQQPSPQQPQSGASNPPQAVPPAGAPYPGGQPDYGAGGGQAPPQNQGAVPDGSQPNNGQGQEQPPPQQPTTSAKNKLLEDVTASDFQDLIQQLPWANITFNMGGQYTVQGDATGAFGPQAAYNAAVDAKYINEDGKPSRPMPQAIQADFSSADAVESWFFSLNDHEDKLAFDKQIHLLIVALFAGNSARFIDILKKQVKREVLGEYEEEQDDDEDDDDENSKKKSKKQSFAGVSPFQSKKREILRATATQRSQFTYTENGIPMRVEVLEFKDNRVQPHILEFLRKSPDLSILRDILQSLLFRICNSSDKDLLERGVGQVFLTRSQAGLGLGELAKNDYTYYYNTFIKPLTELVVHEELLVQVDNLVAQVTNPGTDEAKNAVLPTILGWIFHRLASDDTHRDAVFIQLNQWIAKKKLGYQIVAASSCLALGFVDIDRTMELIKKAMTKESQLVRQAVYNSVEILYQVANGAAKILYHFAKWQRLPQDDPINKQAAETALIFFLLFVRKSLNDGDGSKRELYDMQGQNIQPTSLHTIRAIVNNKADNNPTTEMDVIDLINGCIVHRRASIVNAMLEVLEQWISEADRQPNLQDTIISIMCQLNDGPANRHIKRIVTSTKFRSSSTTQVIRRRCRY